MAKKKYTKDTVRMMDAIDELLWGGGDIQMKAIRSHIAYLRGATNETSNELLAAMEKYLEATCGNS